MLAGDRMDLELLGIDKKQIEILKQKKIISAEALLRQEPLHYWDFSTLMPLDRCNPETANILKKRMPFAITGVCNSYKEEVKNHAAMGKIRVIDDISQNTLFVNVLGVEALKCTFLESSPDNPFQNLDIIPNEIAMLCPNSYIDELKPSCKKKIMELNNLKSHSLKMISGLKSGGKDICSGVKMSVAESILDSQVIAFIKAATKHETSSQSMEQCIQCIRWYLRGLRLDLCICKSKLDNIRLGTLLAGKHVIVGGFIKYEPQIDIYNVLNPAVLSDNIPMYNRLYVQYSSIKGWTNQDHEMFVDRAIKKLSAFDIIPEDLRKKAALPSFKEAAVLMHHPQNWKQCVLAKKRAVFDDLVYLSAKLGSDRILKADEITEVMPKTDVMNTYLSDLPYALTKGQQAAIETVSIRMQNGTPVNTLIQGDVGTGKTCVAFALLLQAAENGFQAALAAPYTTLAWQHYRDMEQIAQKYDISIAFLTSETSAAQKKKIYEAVKEGRVSILIGTHSVFSESISYHKLGLVIIDEEHKFGVVHRGNFMSKGIANCHKITMSATPIPKSLTDTIYGGRSDIITITDKPAQRLPVITSITPSDKEAAEAIVQEVYKGHQAYIVCPAIEKNEKVQGDISIEEKEGVYRTIFNRAGVTLAVLTGKMKASEKTRIMGNFANGNIDVLMATTVIEVGMNVPNATVIAITGADRFGFSTLHQLRGRVGRGKDQAYCILQTEVPNNKLQFLTETNDGFAIAEKDLELRGPGTLFGDRQSGNNYFIDLMLAYPNMFKWICRETKELYQTQTGRDIVTRYEELFLPEEKR